MTKKEFIESVVKESSVKATKKDVELIVNHTFEVLKKAVRKDGRFMFPGFGTFSIRKRKGRTGRNPQTGEAIKIKPSRTVGFKAAKIFKDKL